MKLEICALEKRYGEKEALGGLSFTMEEGICCLLGPNGAGKSTLMNILSGNLVQSGGQILYQGKDIRSLGRDYRARLGYMPQQQTLYPSFTAERFLFYIAALRGMTRKRARERIDWALSLLGLSDVRGKPIRSLSGGMRQRLLLAQAILDDPDILILDEPTAGLDPEQRIAVRTLIAQIGLHKIILISTHVVSDVEFIADHMVLLNRGKRIAEGTPEDLMQPVEGHVFEAEVGEDALRDISRFGVVSGMSRSSTGVVVRLLVPHQPDLPCTPVRPTLEDAYLWHFGGEVSV